MHKQLHPELFFENGRPITAGATPSACAAADRLPFATTATNVSICLKRPYARLFE
ncbi:MAG: hypothetical protein CBARDCOR_1080 [uncultured Caballeronia sp.]|nr:MAG: hypothetical protein CBARDCOR_1080 [uncultured Caballeronia sp.]